ncbi:pyridoxamine 5'-phosphate oxidase [Paraglaciecola sp.]|uniref:pyridoxamine 5'-phosphate oxidase n=1 Tax=Paraglaciecola sp. TaxID=1920173 RepID=UPI003EF337AE
MKEISDIRRQYSQAGLDNSDLTSEPFTLFEKWLKEAVDADIVDPTAMTIATVDAEGQPSQRIVLLKDFSKKGFVFYTNTESKKATDLKHNPKISLHFPWHSLERQVKVYGVAKPLGSVEVAKYFMSRPKPSQLAAWASAQSRPVNSKQVLMEKFAQIKDKFSKGEVPLPSFWGGYVVVPHKIEFWQGGEDRLHDRFMYSKNAQGIWQTERLMP